MTELTPDSAERTLNQAAAILRRLPAEMHQPQAERRREIVREGRILRQATRTHPKTATSWRPTGYGKSFVIHPDAAAERYVIIHRGPPECWMVPPMGHRSPIGGPAGTAAQTWLPMPPPMPGILHASRRRICDVRITRRTRPKAAATTVANWALKPRHAIIFVTLQKDCGPAVRPACLLR